MSLGLALAGASAAASLAGVGASIKGNNDALKAAKNAAKLELSQAKRRAKLDDRLFLEQSALTERQLIEGLNLSDRQAVTAIDLADRQATGRFALEERQSALAAAEDRSALKADLALSKLTAASRALDITRNLSATLGEQKATLAARGVGSGSLPGIFEGDAKLAAREDAEANEINVLTAEADTERGLRAVDTSLSNLIEGNKLTLAQQRESARQGLTFDREASVRQVGNFRDTTKKELQSLRATTKMDLKFRDEAVEQGISAQAQQTRYANTAALIQGFANIAALGYSAYNQYKSIEPTARSTGYTSPRSFTTPQVGRAGF